MAMNATAILLVPGQGVYVKERGTFLTEFPADKETYVEPGLNAPMRARAVGAKLVVASGGPTNRGAEGRTEGEGMRHLLEDFRTAFALDCCAETRALDSAENLLFGLIQARLLLEPDVAIGQIWVWSAWRFKRERFSITARALGVGEQLYFSAFASEPAAGPKALAGERDVVDYMKVSGDTLLLGQAFDDKRQRRYAGRVPYESRLGDLPKSFPGVFEAVVDLKERLQARNGLDASDFVALQCAIRDEVLRPSQVRPAA
jgi:hypothetical protein